MDGGSNANISRIKMMMQKIPNAANATSDHTALVHSLSCGEKQPTTLAVQAIMTEAKQKSIAEVLTMLRNIVSSPFKELSIYPSTPLAFCKRREFEQVLKEFCHREWSHSTGNGGKHGALFCTGGVRVAKHLATRLARTTIYQDHAIGDH